MAAKKATPVEAQADTAITPEALAEAVKPKEVTPGNFAPAPAGAVFFLDEALEHGRVTGEFLPLKPGMRNGNDWGWLIWQDGPISEAGGRNGVFVEDLLRLVQGRVQNWQAGDFACDENRIALLHLASAQEQFALRTARRLAEGTEGTNVGS